MGDELHSDLPNDGVSWWGCMQPERRSDADEWWDDSCPKCLMRLRLLVATGETFELFDVESDECDGDVATALATYEGAL